VGEAGGGFGGEENEGRNGVLGCVWRCLRGVFGSVFEVRKWGSKRESGGCLGVKFFVTFGGWGQENWGSKRGVGVRLEVLSRD
jgi:hypothetical protein